MIYICTHKDFTIPDIDFVDNYKIVTNTPLKETYNVPVINASNSLKSMAYGYCEGLMIKEIYLYENEDWIGINHYRRFFKNLELKTNSVAPPLPLNMNKHYFVSLLSNDLIEVEKIVWQYFPKYRMNYENINVWYPCNIFYFNRDLFNEYCQFIFEVLDIFNEKY